MFCRCGAGARLEGRKYTCLKTEQSSITCDGVFHGEVGCRQLTKGYGAEND